MTLSVPVTEASQVGEILLGSFDDETGIGLEIIALDKGPGIGNVADALRDGHSTGGSAGNGLGAVRRQSQTFDIATWPGRGTAILARIGGDSRHQQLTTRLPRFGGVSVPLRGETACGDAYANHSDGSGWTVLVADGLGHGPSAAQASDEAIRLFRKQENESPKDILSAVHAGIKHTRGGAVSVARYEGRGVLVFAGIGNVAGAIVSGGTIKRMVSLAGTAGHVARRIQEFDYPFVPDDLLVMCSDGIGTNWSLDRYPGLTESHPSLFAAVLYRDFGRGRDDATVLIARGGLS